MTDFEDLTDSLLAEIKGAEDLDALDRVRVAALGTKGAVTAQMKGLRDLDMEARKAAGARLNAIKDEIAAALEARKSALGDADLEARLAGEGIDVTLPARPTPEGRIHPVSQVLDEIIDEQREFDRMLARRSGATRSARLMTVITLTGAAEAALLLALLDW